jgi:hypothetical protein
LSQELGIDMIKWTGQTLLFNPPYVCPKSLITPGKKRWFFFFPFLFIKNFLYNF